MRNADEMDTAVDSRGRGVGVRISVVEGSLTLLLWVTQKGTIYVHAEKVAQQPVLNDTLRITTTLLSTHCWMSRFLPS